MKVVAWLTAPLLGHLRRAADGRHPIHVVASIDRICTDLLDGDADVAVIDPTAITAPITASFARVLSQHGQRVIAYAACSPTSAHAMLELARHGMAHVVFRGFDDGPTSFRRIVENAACTACSVQVLDLLAPALRAASEPAQQAVARLFHEPLRFRTVWELADAAAITRRSLDRALATAGLESARQLLIGARLAWAYPRIRTAGARLGDVSRQAGFSKRDQFARCARDLLGLPPSAVRAVMPTRLFVETLATRLHRSVLAPVEPRRDAASPLAVSVA